MAQTAACLQMIEQAMTARADENLAQAQPFYGARNFLAPVQDAAAAKASIIARFPANIGTKLQPTARGFQHLARIAMLKRLCACEPHARQRGGCHIYKGG